MNQTARLLQFSLKTLRWNSLLPQGASGDRWHAHLHCLRYNGYWPRPAAGGINDFLAFLKASPEIELQRRIRLTDKYLLKAEVERLLGPEWAIPTLGVLSTAEQVMQHEFPPRCVIKPNHLSGEIIYCSNGEPVNRSRIAHWLKASHYRRTRERNYRLLQPVVLVEPWLESPGQQISRVYCLRGTPRAISMSMNYPDGLRYQGIFDPQGNYLNYGVFGCHESDHAIFGSSCPAWSHLEKILQAAHSLAQGLVFARVDVMHTLRGLVVNEVTSIPMGSATLTQPAGHEWDFAQLLFGQGGFNLADFPELTR